MYVRAGVRMESTRLFSSCRMDKHDLIITSWFSINAYQKHMLTAFGHGKFLLFLGVCVSVVVLFLFGQLVSLSLVLPLHMHLICIFLVFPSFHFLRLHVEQQLAFADIGYNRFTGLSVIC